MLADLALALVAGLLTVLSPCVLPALPLVVGSALNSHRLGPVLVALGMVISFTIVGVSVSAAGSLAGLSPQMIRTVAGIFLALAGVLLLSKKLQVILSKLLAPIATAADTTLNRKQPPGLKGQFLVGLLLGAVWSPCSGPSLGAAIGLAAQAQILSATLIMIAFGIGASLPLLAVAYGLRSQFLKSRDTLLATGNSGRIILGWILILVGILISTGTDKSVESMIVPLLPDWLNDLSTRF